MGAAASTGNLKGLQAGRAVAAMMVAAFHANVFLLPQRLYHGDTASPAFNMGYAGVEFFFVLSGFIMMVAHRGDLGRPSRVAAFLRKRVTRIYPFYWAVFGALTLAYLAAPAFGPPLARQPAAVATSFLLWPTPEPPVMEMAWTLRHEMLFYLVFATAILSRWIGALLILLWVAACVAGLTVVTWTFPSRFLFADYNLLFLLGMGAERLRLRIDGRLAEAGLVLGVAAYLAVGLSEAFRVVVWDHGVRTLLYGLAATAIVIGLASPRVRPPRWLVFLGDASYSIYLTHMIAMSGAAMVLARLGAPARLPALALMPLLLLAAAAGGAAAHLLLEKPLLRGLRPRTAARRGAAA